jgi:hypothetical protein
VKRYEFTDFVSRSDVSIDEKLRICKKESDRKGYLSETWTAPTSKMEEDFEVEMILHKLNQAKQNQIGKYVKLHEK